MRESETRERGIRARAAGTKNRRDVRTMETTGAVDGAR